MYKLAATLLVCLYIVQIACGGDVDITKFPQKVALRYKANGVDAFSHVCGGSLYNASVVLTVASCVQHAINTPSKFVVVAGSDILNGNTGSIALVDRIVSNKAYTANSGNNDLAVVFLKTPLPVDNTKIAPTQLATRQLNAGATASVVGWLTNAQAGARLQSTQAYILDQSSCSQSGNFVCVSAGNSCIQGPGSLLIADNQLVGILSAKSVCSQGTGNFVNIVSLRDWLEKTFNGEVEVVDLHPEFL